MGPYHEVVNLNLTIRDPLDRFAIFSNDWPGFENYLAAQWLWYAMGQQDTWIKRFHPSAWERVPHGSSDINSNYGRYVWKEGQFKHCLKLLKEDSSSRRAVIMLNRREVAQSSTKDHICTTSLQFIMRNGALHMITTMRSNELNFGFRTDVFFFTLLQEIMATELDCQVGEYYHNVGSFHVAENSCRPLYRPLHCYCPRYERGELDDLLDPQLKGQFSLTRHLRKLMAFYEPSTDARAQFISDPHSQ
jgi:thymidylate synthase